jgi:hypothetical protein
MIQNTTVLALMQEPLDALMQIQTLLTGGRGVDVTLVLYLLGVTLDQFPEANSSEIQSQFIEVTLHNDMTGINCVMT